MQSRNNSNLAIGFKDQITWVKEVKKILNLNDSSTLGMLQSIAQPLGLPLPDYTPSKGVMKSASKLLEEKGFKNQISANKFNKRAIEKGLLCEIERNSSHGEKKQFKSITKNGLKYGENQVSPKNPKETQPQWYADKFDELLKVLGFQTSEELPYENN